MLIAKKSRHIAGSSALSLTRARKMKLARGGSSTEDAGRKGVGAKQNKRTAARARRIVGGREIKYQMLTNCTEAS